MRDRGSRARTDPRSTRAATHCQSAQRRLRRSNWERVRHSWRRTMRRRYRGVNRSAPARHIRGANGAIVSKRHEDSQRLRNRPRAAIAKRQERCCVRVKHDHVGFVPRRKCTDAIFECERAGTAQRAEKKGLHGIDRTVAELRHLVSFAHRGKQREARTGADIRSQANMYGTAWITCRTQRKQAAAKEQVRGGTMRERGTAGMAAFECRFVQMHPVREHRAPTGQTVMSVNVEIIAPLRKQLHHPRNLVMLLSNMGLHERPGVLTPESAC